MDDSRITSSQFARIFMQYRDKFVSIANSYIHDYAAAEDIVAESFMSFWVKRNKIEITGSPESYIARIIRNKCLNYLRAEAVHKKAGSAMLSDIKLLEQDDFQWLFTGEVQRVFRKVIDSLPEPRRNIFCASRFDSLTYEEIALKFGISYRKVKKEISAALHHIRKELKEYL